MNRKWQTALYGLILLVAGCGGEGMNRIAGERCPLTLDPVPMNIDKAQKMEAKANVFEKLPAGNYKYNGGTFYYRETDSGVQVHILDSKSVDAEKKETFSSKVSCVRNYSKFEAHEGLDVKVSGVSDFTIDDNHKTTAFEVRDFSLKVTRGTRQDKFSKAESKPGSFKEVYDNLAEEAFVLKISDTAYQIRSYYPATKKRGEVFLLISLEYLKPSP